MKYFLIPVIAAAAILAGCASVQSPNARLASTCSTYAHTLYALASVKSDLSQDQINTVNNVRSVVNPICQKHDYSGPRDALNIIAPQLAKLNGIKETTDESN